MTYHARRLVLVTTACAAAVAGCGSKPSGSPTAHPRTAPTITTAALQGCVAAFNGSAGEELRGSVGVMAAPDGRVFVGLATGRGDGHCVVAAIGGAGSGLAALQTSARWEFLPNTAPGGQETRDSLLARANAQIGVTGGVDLGELSLDPDVDPRDAMISEAEIRSAFVS